MVASDAMVNLGPFHLNHAQSTLATLSMISVPPSVNVTTSELDASQTKLKSLTLSMNVAVSTHVNQLDARLLSAQKLFQNVSTMKT
jgi:hypothetical protein